MKIKRVGWVFYVEKPTLKIKKAEKGKPKGFFQSIIDIGKKAYELEEREHEKYEEMIEGIVKQQKMALERRKLKKIL
jgi:hypothetical protein